MLEGNLCVKVVDGSGVVEAECGAHPCGPPRLVVGARDVMRVTVDVGGKGRDIGMVHRIVARLLCTHSLLLSLVAGLPRLKAVDEV